MPVIGTVRGAWEAGHAACDAWDEGHYGEVVWHASTAALQVSSLKADAKLGLAKGKKVRKRGKVRAKQQRAAEKQGKRRGAVKQKQTKPEKSPQRGLQGKKGVERVVQNVEQAARVEQVLQNASPQVKEGYNSIKDWLGEGCRIVRSDEGGMVIMSRDNLKKFRVDFIKEDAMNPIPTHMHLQELRNGKWRDAVKGLHRIYPQGN